MFGTTFKTIRSVIAIVAAVLVVGAVAGTASASKSADNFIKCIQAGGSLKACCLGAGGTYTDKNPQTGLPSCQLPADPESGTKATNSGMINPGTGGSSTGGSTTGPVSGVTAPLSTQRLAAG